MSTNINWSNPYADREGEWLRGNLHAHTSPASGCGTVAPERVLDLYVERGYDFLSFSDHMTFERFSDPRLIWIPGVEWNSETGDHTGIYSRDETLVSRAVAIHDHDELLKAFAGTDSLVVLNHPNWQLRPHYRREELESKSPYDGIEIYNGVIERLDGYPISTDKWDYLLAKGRRVLGFASDDSHLEDDIGLGAIVVRAKQRTAKAVLAAIGTGNFYCSSGLTIRDIVRDGSVIEIETDDAQEIQAIGTGGALLARVREKSMRFDTAATKRSYVRFALYGQGSAMAWTQPFFIE